MKNPATTGKLSLHPHSYVVSVDYKAYWPVGVCIEYHYHDLGQALRHVKWLGEQMRGQNGENAARKNVIMGFLLAEHLRSKKRDKKMPPIKKFVRPEGREKPAGGIERLPEF